MGDRILITGASGFLGGWLVGKAAGKWEVHAVYRTRAYDASYVRWHRCDLTDLQETKALVERVRPDVVVHAAAEANLDWCEVHRDQAFGANVGATELLAQICAKLGIRLIYISTDMVFDGEKGWYSEDDPVNPISFYGKTKVLAEQAVQAAGGEALVVRTALMFGDPLYGGTSFSVWMEEQVRSGKEVRLFTDQYRTPLLVQNAAAAILELARADFRGTLHLAGTERVDRFAFGKLMAAELGLDAALVKPAKLATFQFAAPRPRDLSLRTDLARSILRETELLDLHTAIKQLAAWRSGTGP